MHDLYLLPIIFLISLILTMVGLGGGLFYAPLFILLGFYAPVAVATSLFLNSIAALSAAIIYWRKKMVDLRMGLGLLIASTLTAPIGAYIAPHVNKKLYLFILTGVISVAAVQALTTGKPKPGKFKLSIGSAAVTGTLIGAGIGLIAGLLGIGGGVFIVPLLIGLAGMDTKRAAATSIFVVTFSSMSGFLAHAGLHDMDWGFTLPAALVCFAGGQVGSRLMSVKLNPMVIKRIFGVILLLFVVKLLQTAISLPSPP